MAYRLKEIMLSDTYNITDNNLVGAPSFGSYFYKTKSHSTSIGVSKKIIFEANNSGSGGIVLCLYLQMQIRLSFIILQHV